MGDLLAVAFKYVPAKVLKRIIERNKKWATIIGVMAQTAILEKLPQE
jgi:hypothetical protein